MGPKEDEVAARDRARDRRMAQLDSDESAKETALGLSDDLRRVYGVASMFNLPTKAKKPSTPKTPFPGFKPYVDPNTHPTGR